MIDYPGLEKDIKPWTKENITKIGNPALKFIELVVSIFA